VNGLDLDGRFHYTFVYDLGATALSPAEYMARVAANFARVFPFAGEPEVLPASGTRFTMQSPFGPVRVYVAARWASGWRFGTQLGHPDYPGWISFSFFKRDGHMYLRVHAYVPEYSAAGLAFRAACGLWAKRCYRAFAGRIWSSFAENLRDRHW
jgi:hypothetical protein